jgi:outer membrane protein assembly factor BamB
VVALDGTVFVHNGDELVAVRPDGTLRWRRPLMGGATTPMTAGWDGTIYLVQGNQLTAIDPEGEERWRTQLEVLTPPRLVLGVDDRLRVGTYNGTVKLQANGELAQQITGASGPLALAPDGAIYVGSPAYKLSAFEPTGAVRFNFARLLTRIPAPEEPVLGLDQRAYISRTVGTLSHWTYAVDAQGQMLWEYPELASGMVADDSGGLVIAQTNHVTALRSDGSLRWDYQANAVMPTAPFLTDDGRLCFSAGNRLTMLQTELRPAASGWAMWRADAQRSGRTAVSSRVLGCSRTEDDELELSFAGKCSTAYVIEQSSDLDDWSVVAECVALAGTTRVILPLTNGQPCLFFRVRQE